MKPSAPRSSCVSATLFMRTPRRPWESDDGLAEMAPWQGVRELGRRRGRGGTQSHRLALAREGPRCDVRGAHELDELGYARSSRHAHGMTMMMMRIMVVLQMSC